MSVGTPMVQALDGLRFNNGYRMYFSKIVCQKMYVNELMGLEYSRALYLSHGGFR